MKLNKDILKLLLYATKNRKIRFGRTANIVQNEKIYNLKDSRLNIFNEDNDDYWNLSLSVENANGELEDFSINNIKSIEYDIGENSSDEFKIWFHTVDFEKLAKLKYIDDEEEYNNVLKESYNTWRIFIYPDLYFLDKTGKAEKIDIREFMFVNPVFKERDFKVDYDKVFIAMPFNDDKYNLIYNKYIKPILKKMYYEAIRVDEKTNPGDVMEFVWKEINESAFVIADASIANPNVLYEIGIAHTLGKEVIILTDSPDKVPFDIKKNRYLSYSIYDEKSIKEMKQKLESAIKIISSKMNYGFKEKTQILSINEIENLANEMSINAAKIVVKRCDLAIVIKKDDWFVKKIEEAERMNFSAYYEEKINKINICFGESEQTEISLNIDISNNEYYDILKSISKGQAKCEIYIVSDGMKEMSMKKIFDTSMSKLNLSRQLARIK
ncbi:hypothetical protein [Clostridium butyricum]|uniref:hypothetical protein n=1 Tax=Clostridium butyricum TaxID=1492 RepID=UPI00168AAB4F|nr:hypothetical protein [Clostridium butyricum]MDB2152480.1 hypothetical protein [Clostridium butyricum]